MRPVSPVFPDREVEEKVYVKDGCEDLPVFIDKDGGGTSRWLLTPEEIAQIAAQGFIYVHQLVARFGVQPIWLGVDPPVVFDGQEKSIDSVLEADTIGE
jgi:hypothetical protein